MEVISNQRNRCSQHTILPPPQIRPHEILRLQEINKTTLQANNHCPIIIKQTSKIPNLIQSCIIALTKVLRCKGEIVAVMFSIDYVIYYKNISHLFEKSQYYGLYKEISIEDMQIGETVYFTRLSVKPQWMRKGLGKKMIYEMSKYLKEKGYNGSYSGVVSPVSQKLFQNNGGKLIVSREFKTEVISF